MPDKTYKLIELVGVSEELVQQAIRNAVTRASFEVTEVRGLVKEGKVRGHPVGGRQGGEQGQQGTGAKLEEQERENAAHLEVGKALNPKYGASSRG